MEDSFDISNSPDKASMSAEFVDCESWLAEVNLLQYTASFKANFAFGDEDNKYLSLKKLSLLKMSDLPKMNITDFSHQKIIIDHIKNSIKSTQSSESNSTQDDNQIFADDTIMVHSSMSTSGLTLPPLPNLIPVYHDSSNDLSSLKTNLSSIVNNTAISTTKRNQLLRKSFEIKAKLSIDKLRSNIKQYDNINLIRNGELQVRMSYFNILKL